MVVMGQLWDVTPPECLRRHGYGTWNLTIEEASSLSSLAAGAYSRDVLSFASTNQSEGSLRLLNMTGWWTGCAAIAESWDSQIWGWVSPLSLPLP